MVRFQRSRSLRTFSRTVSIWSPDLLFFSLPSVYEKAYRATARIAHEHGFEEYESTFLALVQNILDQKAAHQKRASERGTTVSYTAVLKATLDYTDLLLSAINTDSIACIVAAICPCSKLYGFIGRSIQSMVPDHNHAYSEWISVYADPRRIVLVVYLSHP